MWTSPSKDTYAKIYKKNKGQQYDFDAKQAEDDSASVIAGESEDECIDQDENKNEIAYHKRKLTEKEFGKYDSITKTEIYGINNYCRASLWRRAKFINDKQLGDEFNNVCTILKIEPENENHKYVDVCLLIQNNMNYRRSYSTKRMRDTIVGKLIYFVLINLLRNNYIDPYSVYFFDL